VICDPAIVIEAGNAERVSPSSSIPTFTTSESEDRAEKLRFVFKHLAQRERAPNEQKGGPFGRPALTFLVLTLPALWVGWLIYRYGVDTPWGDEWDTTRLLVEKMQAGTLGLGDFFAFHNEHRIFFPRVLTFALALFTHWNVRVELLMILDPRFCLLVEPLARGADHRLAEFPHSPLAPAGDQRPALFALAMGKPALGFSDRVLFAARDHDCLSLGCAFAPKAVRLSCDDVPLSYQHFLNREWFRFLVSYGTAPSAVEWQGASARRENLVADLGCRRNRQYRLLFPWICPACGAPRLDGSGRAPAPGDPIYSRLSWHSLFRHGTECILDSIRG
jgi:hypothetical protein